MKSAAGMFREDGVDKSLLAAVVIRRDLHGSPPMLQRIVKRRFSKTRCTSFPSIFLTSSSRCDPLHPEHRKGTASLGYGGFEGLTMFLSGEFSSSVRATVAARRVSSQACTWFGTR